MVTPRRIAVIGLGLIGGSFALALRRRGWRVTGFDRSVMTRRLALRRGAVVAAARSLRSAVREQDVVALCVPLQSMAGVLRAIAPVLGPRAIVTDVCGVKSPVLALIRRHLRDPRRFVGAHPMAGSERSGIRSADAGLFHGRPCVLTPVPDTDPGALRVVSRLWRRAGARPVRMTPAAHDRAVAVTSHLPHLLAFSLAASAREAGKRRLIAGSFLDATRVARSDPALWAGIFTENRGDIRRALAALCRTAGRLLTAPGRRGRALRSAAAALPPRPR